MSDDHAVFTAAPEGVRRGTLLELATRGPVNRVTLPNGVPAWLVTGRAEARAALTDSRLRRHHGASAPYADRLPEITLILQQHMLNQNPPEHTRLRKLVTLAFTRRRTEQLEPAIEKISAELVDEVRTALDAGEVVDLIPAYTFPFSFRVMSLLLGLPRADEPVLRQHFDVLTRGSASSFDEYRVAGWAMIEHIRGLIAANRQEPGDDLLSALIAARDGDDRLSDDELTSMLFILMIAGHETTANLIANGLLLLLQHPDQLAALRADPALITGAVEEILRYDGPVQATFPAVATDSIELGGRTIAAGEVVLVSPIAASLDGDPQSQPSEFDATGPSSAHLAFGHGIHHCVGAPLARLESRIALRDLITDLPGLDTADDTFPRKPTLLINSLTALRVRRR